MALRPRKRPPLLPLPSSSIALFAGGGGLELGLSKAVASLGGHLRTVCHVEREAYAAAVLVARMEEQRLGEAPIWDLVESFDGTPWYGKVDLVAGGSPCQDMSLAGKREGLEGDRSILFFQLIRIVREVFPKYVVWENVAGAVKFLPHVLDAFERARYFVGERDEEGKWSEASSPSVVAVRASDVGAPHKRERVFLLGVRRDVWDEVAYTEGNGWFKGPGREHEEGRRSKPSNSRQTPAVAYSLRSSGSQPGLPEQGVGTDALRSGQAELGRCCSSMANPQRDTLRDESRRRGRPSREGAAVARDSSEDLGDSNFTRLQGRGLRQGERGGERLVGPASCEDELANTGRKHGGEIRPAPKSGESKSKLHNQRRDSELPYWPPGPEDAARWQQVLQVRPDLSPALPQSPLRGVADELASGLDRDPAELRQALSNRADRLRLLGNGVVPDQAAQAFLILWEKLMEKLNGHATGR